MALFISLAYISISLDFTGLLRFSAFWVARKGGSSGQLLYLYLYAFFLICGVMVGNDPVILSGTAFLAYFTRVSGIAPPTAWIFAQFTAANMASVVLVSSNPTNLVLSGAYGLSFIKYTVRVILPFLAGAVFVYPILAFALFRSPRLIPPSLDIELSEQESGNQTLVDKNGAIFGSVLLLITLAVLVGTSTVGVPVWEVTVPPAVVMLLRDAFHDWRHRQPIVFQRNRATEEPIPREIPLAELSPAGQTDRKPDLDAPTIQVQEQVQDADAEPAPASGTQTPSEAGSTDSTVHTTAVSLQGKLFSVIERLESCFPTVSGIAHRLPIPLLPFAFLMFILVQGLSTKGWVEVWADGGTAWTRRTGTIGAVGGMGFVACMLCNICGTNIGATILLARVLQVWTSTHEIDQRTRDGALYALALGSNYGAFTLTFSASLAGLLWREILHQKGIHVRPRQFLLLNLPTSFVAMLCSCAVLVGEVYIIDRKQT
ncbi:hypothetical protein NM688_g2941 [Phlebia brevispora]|uniref:Uncharacterized protein n=1 Tax=Phlebia brevispora TaxID=194682 RepID=A0ACC1T7A8_9APHY|nr:hypothetical protein NM688_g2941 [Phlebia brevispora]